jgi:hypothetical protein
MGISFLYIGRDESTLKDKLRIETRMDEFPVEMNFTSPFGARRAGRAANSTTFNLAGVLAGFGIPASTNLSQIFPGIPSDFNISDPYVVAPFPPFQRRQTPPPQWGWNALKGGLNAPKGALNAPQGSLNVPQGGLNPLNPATMKTMEGLLTTFVPGLPKGFTLSDIFSPGGIVISEVDTLFGGFRGEKGTPNPSGGFGGSVHRLLARSLNQVGLRYPRE